MSTRLVAVGAVAIDRILSVPHFPEPDSKTRATSLMKRRGGNSVNTFEVLQQLVNDDRESQRATSGFANAARKSSPSLNPELYIIAALPSRSSAETNFVATSFASRISNDDECSNAANVNLSLCLYRENETEAVSSYIIFDQSTSSRTIINHNALPEMTFEEFKSAAVGLIDPAGTEGIAHLWFHFEGRLPPIALECIRWLRAHSSFAGTQLRLTISVEVEKAGREGLQELALEADVVFYSRSWAEAAGYSGAEDCLRDQANLLDVGRGEKSEELRGRVLICTWGAQGACAVTLSDSPSAPTAVSGPQDPFVHSPAYTYPDQPIVDTTGAGDTFIAGVLYGMICRVGAPLSSRSWTLEETLAFANGLAGRKILQAGFRGLGDASRILKGTLDERARKREGR